MKQQRNTREYVKLAAKGMAMGAADAVPGVSGGTVAFMTGIYEELIYSLRQFDIDALKLVFTGKLKQAWNHVNGNFLITLLSGILLSLVGLASGVLYLLEHYPVLLWAFFFGLIFASTWSLARHVDGWNADRISVFGIGVVIAYLITSMSPAAVEPTTLMIFLSGMIAICAMILPGISGSFILLLLGMYTPILGAIKALEINTLLLFAVGCGIGLLSFSRVLNWAFSHHKTMTLALLGGFMLGSLNKVWPWKYTSAYTINRHGEEVPLVQDNVLPMSYQDMTGQEPYLVAALALMAVGFVLVILLDRRPAKVEQV